MKRERSEGNPEFEKLMPEAETSGSSPDSLGASSKGSSSASDEGELSVAAIRNNPFLRDRNKKTRHVTAALAAPAPAPAPALGHLAPAPRDPASIPVEEMRIAVDRVPFEFEKPSFQGGRIEALATFMGISEEVLSHALHAPVATPILRKGGPGCIRSLSSDGSYERVTLEFSPDRPEKSQVGLTLSPLVARLNGLSVAVQSIPAAPVLVRQIPVVIEEGAVDILNDAFNLSNGLPDQGTGLFRSSPVDAAPVGAAAPVYADSEEMSDGYMSPGALMREAEEEMRREFFLNVPPAAVVSLVERRRLLVRAFSLFPPAESPVAEAGSENGDRSLHSSGSLSGLGFSGES